MHVRSTKYDKKGSVVGDLIKRLEAAIRSCITSRENFYKTCLRNDDTISLLESLEYLRKAIPDIAEKAVQQMMKYDLYFECRDSEYPPIIVVRQNDRYFTPMGIDIRFSCGRGLGFRVSNAGEIEMVSWSRCRL